METKTDNELIAEFMGGRIAYVSHGKKEVWVFPFREDDGGSDELLFDTSWDWLMPVVEEMEFGVWTIRPGFVEFKSYSGELRPEKQFNFNTSTQGWQHPNDEIPFIWLVYSMVVRGIKWFNSQKHGN